MRDYASISPSARSILLVRAQTDLPYARQAALHLFGEAAVRGAAADPRVSHFEERARSIDAAVAGHTRVLELGGGLSFRGLAMAERGVTYVDTDLPDMVAVKRELVAALRPGVPGYRLEALDVMDRAAVDTLVDTMPAGPLAIVNEGLLVYLGTDEKSALFDTIRGVLARRGGVWITADVYVRGGGTLFRNARAQAFAAKHDIDRNKFADYAEAEALFASRGLAIVSRLPSPHHRQTWVLATL